MTKPVSFLMATSALLINPFIALSHASDGDVVELAPYAVSGEKIERPLVDTLSSVGFLSGDLLDLSGAKDINDAFRFLANVRDADWIDSGIVIRGINSEGIGGPIGSPMASVYIDGVPQTNNGARRGPLGVWDVAQVEVLRGPQSTLIGRNALAGGVIVRTNDPSFEPDYALLVGAGNNGYHEAAFMASGAITESLAFRIAGELDHSDGEIYYPNYIGMPNIGERAHSDYKHIRGKLLGLPFGKSGASFLLAASHTYNSPSYSDVDGSSAGLDFFDDRQWGNQTSPLFDEARSTETSITSLQIDVPLDEYWKLQSVSAYTKTVTDRPSVDDATRGEIDEDELTQELRAAYTGDKLESVLGLFLLHNDSTNSREQQRPWEPFLRRDQSDGETHNAALFGEARWRFADDLSVVLGLRFDREELSTVSTNERIDAGKNIISTNRYSTDADFDALLPKSGLIYHISEESNLSLTVQRAYRSGGAAINNVTSTEYTYDPEYAWNYEVAFKGTSLDRRFYYGVNLFFMDWKYQQINVPQVPGDFTSDIILNAGSSTVWGGEVELSYRPDTRLQLFASIGLAKTEFNDFRFVQFGSEVDLSGMQFPQAPDFSAVVGGDYEIGYGLKIGGDIKYTSTALSRSALEGLPADELPSYIIANLRFGWEFDNWSILLYVDNAFDEEYFLYRYDDPAFHLATIGRGRTYGASLKWEY